MKTQSKRPFRVAPAAALLTAAALALSACSTDDASSPGSTGTRTAKVSAQLISELTTGTQHAPDLSPIKPKPGANVWIVTCSQAAEGCVTITKGAEKAAQAAGWKPTVFDGKLNPETYSEGIRAAIAAGAAGIIAVAIDCAPVKSALEQAKKAGIPVVGNFAVDCDDPSVGGQRLFTSTTINWGDFVYKWAMERAKYISALLDGKGDVIALAEPDFATGARINDGFRVGMRKYCPKCNVVQTVDILGADFGNGGVAQKVSSAVIQHKEATVIFSPFDAVTGFMPQSLAQVSDRHMLVVGGEGLPSTIDLIRKGTVHGVLGLDSAWIGWASVDSLARVIEGEKVPDEGLGWQLVTKDVNLGASGPYVSTVDYVSAYKAAWGK